MSDSPGKRLASFREGLQLTQRAFAAELGFSGGRIASIETDVAAPSRAFLERIAERYRISADWLLHGQGEMLMEWAGPGFSAPRGERVEPADQSRPLAGDLTVTWKQDGRELSQEFAFVRRYDLSVSAGTGLEAVEGAETEMLAFSTAWLRSVGASADLSVLVRVRGDSMVPTVPDGALVLIHVADQDTARPGIFAIVREGQAFVKRITPLARSPSGRPTSVAILSDNPGYPPDVVEGSDMNNLRIVGRVRCVLWTL